MTRRLWVSAALTIEAVGIGGTPFCATRRQWRIVGAGPVPARPPALAKWPTGMSAGLIGQLLTCGQQLTKPYAGVIRL